MTRKLLVFICVIALLSVTYELKAQATVTSTNMPNPGDQFFNQIIQDTTLSPGINGANVVWDYSSYFISVNTFNEFYRSPVATPYQANYPAANLAVNNISGSSDYDFYTRSSSALEYWGSVFQGNVVSITNNQNVLTLPFSYGNTVTNAPVTGTAFNNLVTLSGSISTNADAWGTLILSNGTYSNALRVTMNINLIGDYGGGPTERYNVTKYLWYIAGQKAPKMQIVMIDIAGDLQTYKNKMVLVSTITTGINENTAGTTLSLYPNPSSELINLDFSSSFDGIAGYSIFDNCGREVRVASEQKVAVRAGRATVNISGLAAGSYRIALNRDDVSVSRSFVKIQD